MNLFHEHSAWREYWCTGDGGQPVGGDKQPVLEAHWRSFFRDSGLVRPNAVIADIGAGKGAALAAVAWPAGSLRLAVDCSEAAARAAARMTGASGVAADAGRLPFADQTANAVISQFGIEYAGDAAFAEAARLMTPAARFCSISHFMGGALDLECAANAALLEEVLGTRLFESARAAFAESFRRQRLQLSPLYDDRIENRTRSAFDAVRAAVERAPHRAARHTLARFLDDFGRLASRRLAFDESEASAWINGMDSSLNGYLTRMRSMRAAALAPRDLQRIGAIFAAGGLVDFRASPFHFDRGEPPAAWVIEARRPT